MIIIGMILAFAIGCLVGMWMASSECKEDIRVLEEGFQNKENKLMERIKVLAQRIDSWKCTASGLQDQIIKLEKLVTQAGDSAKYKDGLIRVKAAEIVMLSEKLIALNAKFDRPRCDRCGKIVAKKDYKEGKCKKCFKASVEAIQKIETQVAEPEYLTTEQAGEILKAGGEVILIHSDGVDGCVYYMRPDGHVGCVDKSDNMRTGAYCSSVEEFVKGWGDQRWAIFKAPPVCKKCGKKTEPGADLCDKCFVKEAGIKKPIQPEPPMPEPPLLACAEIGDACFTRSGKRLTVVSITATRWRNCPILCSNDISYRLDGDVAVVGETRGDDYWYNDMIVAIEKSGVKA